MTTCVVCGTVRQPNPQAEDGWRVVEVLDSIHAVCPGHWAKLGATREQVRQAYIAVFKKILERRA